jgi:hypothetical protein
MGKAAVKRSSAGRDGEDTSGGGAVLLAKEEQRIWLPEHMLLVFKMRFKGILKF